jgi:hypothetical protein
MTKITNALAISLSTDWPTLRYVADQAFRPSIPYFCKNRNFDDFDFPDLQDLTHSIHCYIVDTLLEEKDSQSPEWQTQYHSAEYLAKGYLIHRASQKN